MLAHAGAAVLASHPTPQGKREGVPVALMEAMSCGTPVVATAISGIPELVESGRTGFLVPSGNASLLAAALELLIGDPELCDRLGQGGRRKVRNEFNLHASAARLMELFHADPVSKAGCAAPASAAGSG
jgi:glycosyltransferase involved in cell wall biosynthesis